MRSQRRLPPPARLEPVSHVPPRPRVRPDRPLAWKHALDRVGAAVLLAVTSPLFAGAALLAALAGERPVLVRRRRVGRDGRSFDMFGLPPLPFLRRWQLDQLPQLLNVVRGEMSFVGPRPERPEFVELFGANLRRLDAPRRVKPGLTGWSQLQTLQRSAPLAERVRWDDVYVENWSPWLDLRILAMTVVRVVRDGPE